MPRLTSFEFPEASYQELRNLSMLDHVSMRAVLLRLIHAEADRRAPELHAYFVDPRLLVGGGDSSC